MVKQAVWMGIIMGIFFAGLAIGAIPGEIEKANVQANLERFDFMDFIAFNNQDWDLVSTTHSQDVKVIYANGLQTNNFV